MNRIIYTLILIAIVAIARISDVSPKTYVDLVCFHFDGSVALGDDFDECHLVEIVK